MQPFGTEKCNNMFAVGTNAGVRMSRFGMSCCFGLSLASRPTPKFLPICFVVAKNQPLLFAIVVGGISITSSFDLQRHLALFGNCGNQKDLVAIDDRTRVTQTGYLGFPQDSRLVC